MARNGSRFTSDSTPETNSELAVKYRHVATAMAIKTDSACNCARTNREHSYARIRLVATADTLKSTARAPAGFSRATDIARLRRRRL